MKEIVLDITTEGKSRSKPGDSKENLLKESQFLKDLLARKRKALTQLLGRRRNHHQKYLTSAVKPKTKERVKKMETSSKRMLVQLSISKWGGVKKIDDNKLAEMVNHHEWLTATKKLVDPES